MATSSQRPALDAAIDTLTLAKKVSTITPAKAAFDSVGALLTTVEGSMINEQDYVELGLNCANICGALNRGTNGKKLDDLSQSVREAISQLTTTAAEIERKAVKQSQRNPVSRLFRPKDDKETIAAWKLDLNRILHVFNTELVTNASTETPVLRPHVSNAHFTIAKHQEGTDDRNRSARTSTRGESPPPPPKACFGRDELIESVVGLAENLENLALVGAGGIGKTSIALTVLHHDRIKKRFGDNRRFIRCDQFPASRSHLLSRLSKVIGAGIENPEDLTPLIPFLSSKEMILFLDNAESILDPHGPDAWEVYTVVEELSRFSNICLGITSRISTVPSHFKRPIVSTLSIESACDIFYHIHEDGGRSDIVSDLVRQLDFHALSITLLASTASHNMWDYNRLAKEWNVHRAQVLQTDYNGSLATTVELSLASPTFRKLGPNARDLLEVIAFFPQGINEDNIDWLFPTITDRNTMFDKFCLLSLTYRSNGFITMLAPIRDYLGPPDPKSSQLLCATKDCYFSRLSFRINRARPGFEEGRWIIGEDVNVEHLLNIFTSIDAESDVIWDICTNFFSHLYCHKSRHTVLGPKIEGLPDGHRSKPGCLVELSCLFGSLGNYAERKRLLTRALKLERNRRDDPEVARILKHLSIANQGLRLRKEGIQQVKEALEIYERLGHTQEQANCWESLSWLLLSDNQLDDAEKAATRAIDLLPQEGQELQLCKCHRTLGDIYRTKGNREKAVHHFHLALEIGSLCKWDHELSWINYSLATLCYQERKLDEANTYIEKAKSLAVNRAYLLGRMMEMQAKIWNRQGRFEEARSEVSRALEIFVELGAPKYIGTCESLLRKIAEETSAHVTPSSPSSHSEFSASSERNNQVSNHAHKNSSSSH